MPRPGAGRSRMTEDGHLPVGKNIGLSCALFTIGDLVNEQFALKRQNVNDQHMGEFAGYDHPAVLQINSPVLMAGEANFC